MKKREFYLLSLSDLKAQSRAFLSQARSDKVLTRREIRDGLDSIIATFPSKAHQFMKAELRAYQMGYLAAIEEEHTRFLYFYKRRFYAPHESRDTGLTPWDQIPHEDWGKLSQYGGRYWIGGKRPAPYDVAEVV